MVEEGTGSPRARGRSPAQRGEEIVHPWIARELELLAAGAVGDAADVDGAQVDAAEMVGELGRGEEGAPAVGAAGQPAQQVLRTDDGGEEARQRAAERGEDDEAAGAGGLGQGSQEERQVGDVLDHLEGQHEVETMAAVGHRLQGRGLVGDLEPGLLGMGLGDLDQLGRGVDAGDPGTETGEGLGHEAAAAADVEDAQPRQRLPDSGRAAQMAAGLVADIGDADRPHPVQGRHRPGSVPPALGQGREALDLARVDLLHRLQPSWRDLADGAARG